MVFEEFRNTAGVMEEEGLLPNVQKEEMEQGERCKTYGDGYTW